MENNPDFRFNRMRKSRKTEFFEVHTERAVITHLNSVVRHIPHFFKLHAHMQHVRMPHVDLPEFLICKEPLVFCFQFNSSPKEFCSKMTECCKPLKVLNSMLFAQK